MQQDNDPVRHIISTKEWLEKEQNWGSVIDSDKIASSTRKMFEIPL